MLEIVQLPHCSLETLTANFNKLALLKNKPKKITEAIIHKQAAKPSRKQQGRAKEHVVSINVQHGLKSTPNILYKRKATVVCIRVAVACLPIALVMEMDPKCY